LLNRRLFDILAKIGSSCEILAKLFESYKYVLIILNSLSARKFETLKLIHFKMINEKTRISFMRFILKNQFSLKVLIAL